MQAGGKIQRVALPNHRYPSFYLISIARALQEGVSLFFFALSLLGALGAWPGLGDVKSYRMGKSILKVGNTTLGGSGWAAGAPWGCAWAGGAQKCFSANLVAPKGSGCK